MRRKRLENVHQEAGVPFCVIPLHHQFLSFSLTVIMDPAVERGWRSQMSLARCLCSVIRIVWAERFNSFSIWCFSPKYR